MIAYKTISEQKLEYLESLQRPLSDEESDDLRRAMHAVYCRERQREKAGRIIGQHRNEERRLLRKLQREARQQEWYPNEVRG